MKSVVMLYEDQYCSKLHLLIKRLRQAENQASSILEYQTSNGTGNFKRVVPGLLRTPLKQTRSAPDFVLCIADADRPENLVPKYQCQVQYFPSTLDWVCAFEHEWRNYVIHQGRLSPDDANKVVTFCLRWSKESLLVSTPDALKRNADPTRISALNDLFNNCNPSPLELNDDLFVDSYQKPQRCMDSVFQAGAGRKYKKGRDDDNIMDNILKNQSFLSQTFARNPDLTRVLRYLRSLTEHSFLHNSNTLPRIAPSQNRVSRAPIIQLVARVSGNFLFKISNAVQTCCAATFDRQMPK